MKQNNFRLHLRGFRLHCDGKSTPCAPFRFMTARSTLIAGLLLVSACTTASLHELRRTTPQGDAFQTALAQEYLAFAESEAKQYDWRSSKIFADKGIKAAYGQSVAPETVEAWDIEQPFIADLVTAREQLMGVLTTENAASQPVVTARAQFFYDCWLEQQEEAWQEDDIASCREGFYRSVKTLIGVPEAEPETEAEAMVFSSAYIVFFDWDKYVLTAEAQAIVQTAAADLLATREENYEVILNGHADSSGSAEYNLKLSQKRAEAVKAALVARGLVADRIQYYAFGESDPRIATPKGKREPANRRVEIFFNQ